MYLIVRALAQEGQVSVRPSARRTEIRISNGKKTKVHPSGKYYKTQNFGVLRRRKREENVFLGPLRAAGAQKKACGAKIIFFDLIS
jgi:hypothetical protein